MRARATLAVVVCGAYHTNSLAFAPTLPVTSHAIRLRGHTCGNSQHQPNISLCAAAMNSDDLAQTVKLESFVRPVEKNDISHIKAIADTTELFPGDMVDDMVSGYLDGSKQDIWFVFAEEDSAKPPIAFGFCEQERMTEGTWNLLALAVMPNRQGGGVGSAMLRYIETRLSAAAARILLVETAGTKEFERVRDFYKKAGFAEEATIREFYEAGVDKVIYWKRL